MDQKYYDPKRYRMAYMGKKQLNKLTCEYAILVHIRYTGSANDSYLVAVPKSVYPD